ncbi:MAG TPA: nitronate monooxygenase family protein [Burkholderiales bacterium]|nr:nitronate monooxygenase family protein [Burkholderiales bacterium]
MSLPVQLQGKLALPVVGAPMFIVSNPELVIAQCTSGIVGSFPALNARPKEALENWILRIKAALAAYRTAHPGEVVAPFAVNQIVHHSNSRLEHDLEVCIRQEVPIIITSLRSPEAVVKRVHAYGGIVLHDVINVRHAQKALEAGVDGLILVCAGAGGHAGMLSPFALVNEVRQFYDGLLVLAGAITNGRGIFAAQVMGCDLAYMGTHFIATRESNADEEYKQMIVGASATDIVYTPYFSGVHGNYLKPSIRAAGLDPDNLPSADPSKMDFDRRVEKPKAWKSIWGAGQGVGNIREVMPAREVIARLRGEYESAKQGLTLPTTGR